MTVRGRARPLPKHRQIDAEKLADTAQRVLDLAVHLARRQVDEPGGEVRQQRLELETVLELIGRRLRMIDRGHASEVYALGSNGKRLELTLGVRFAPLSGR